MNKILKHSRQREALVKLLNSVTSHPSAEWLYTELKKEFPNISLATVYRNLNLLSQKGSILKLDVGTGTEHYDGDTKMHYHFVCTKCGAIIDINMPCIDYINSKVEDILNAKVSGHSLIFYGICKNCL
ncbi:MAG: transcriptional repressor [Clostridia bacterium]|nr:transcriptional repressor [Clostridia bacterium]